MKVFSVVGYRKSGKTTTIVELIKELKKRGYKVASIKDIHDENFTIEKKHSDSWQHWKASKDVVFARGLNETYQIWHRQLTLNELLKHLNTDYIIIEGMKSTPIPRIVCANSEEELDNLVDGTVFAISGRYANNHNKYKNLKAFHSINQIKELTDIVEEKVFDVLPYAKNGCCDTCGLSCEEMVSEILAGNKSRDDCIVDRKQNILLKVNGKEIKIVPFVQNILRDIVISFVQNLKGCKKGKIEIEINK